ncbi:hypothetical protein KRP22_002283 [Phytophthora ramorum]|nr:Zinc finger protein DZIP1L [Phytophthora ramorum]
MRRFCWRERSEQLNWRLLGALDVDDAVRRGDPALLEPYALHVTFARLPNAPKDPTTRDAWFLLRVLQLSMEYLLYMRARDGDVLDSLSQEMRQLETARDELLLREHKWKARTRSGEKQVEKLHQVLQNIAKLLQIHGASPSAVATIETLLTELISGRRARQRKKTLMEKGDEEMDEVQEARACGFCGKLFSSAEYLEKHLVRRHAGESLEVETLVKHKMKRDFEREGEDKENKMKNEDAAASEVAMQKMVQQVERALHDHEEKLRSLAEEEATKVQQMYERLHAETKLAGELNLSRNKTEDEHKVSQRQMDEVCQQKQKAEDELEDLKQQIQFLTLKGNMMRSAGLPASSPSRDDNALVAAETEIRNLQQTLEVVNRELAASREELAKVQALHLSALRKKKELVDKLASSREDSSVVLREISTQTEQRATVDGGVQTDYDQISSSLIENETLTESYAPACADVGTDALVLSYEDMGIQTVELLQAPALFDAEVQAVIEDDPIPTTIAAVRHEGPDLTSQEPLNDTGSLMEEIVPPHPTAQKKDDQISDYIQQIHSQDLLDTLAERAQSAASKAVTTEAQQNPIARDYSSIPRHKYVRSRFHHDEDVVKERVSSCLSQLEQFSRRFGVPAKSAWLSDENLQIIQQALHGHLEVLPTEVLAKMVDSENAVNAIIEKEWMPMEKTRQQALERFKMEARAKSEVSQGLVRQAMAAFGASMKPNQPSGASNSDGVVATNTDQLSIASEFELIQPMARLDRTQSIVASSEMFFDADIPSLGVESESVEASTSAVVMGLVDLVDRSAEAGNHEDSSPSALHTPVRVVANDDQNDSVMSFDDSDIEEVVLT